MLTVCATPFAAAVTAQAGLLPLAWDGVCGRVACKRRKGARDPEGSQFSEPVRVRACVRACMPCACMPCACMHVRACVRACMPCACMHVRACVRARVRACVRVCVRQRGCIDKVRAKQGDQKTHQARSLPLEAQAVLKRLCVVAPGQ